MKRNFAQCPPGDIKKLTAKELTFMMGSNDDQDERPPHQVQFDRPFLMQTTAVTLEQFALFDANYELVERETLNQRAPSRQCPAIMVSWYDAEWYRKRNAPYGKNPAPADAGPAAGSSRVIRGGGWRFNAIFCRSAFRFPLEPAFRHRNLGFRLVRGC